MSANPREDLHEDWGCSLGSPLMLDVAGGMRLFCVLIFIRKLGRYLGVDFSLECDNVLINAHKVYGKITHLLLQQDSEGI
jgi:hypothetical protein